MFSYEKYSKIRDSKGVTDYEVAKNTGVQTATLTNWKHGRYTPKADKINKIAIYFGVSLETLMDLDNKEVD